MKEVTLIIGAMDEEVKALLDRMDNVEQHTLNTIEYYTGDLGGAVVVVAKSGIGKVNAAFTATMLISKFSPVEVINIGSAGGLQQDQKVGDIVVATELRYHDFDIGEDTYSDDRFIFNTNTAGIETILSELAMPYHTGLIVSGDQFITKGSNSFNNIQLQFDTAIAVEMEASAVAAIAEKFSTPVIILRALSDVTHTEGNELQFEEYLALASANSALICETYLKNRHS